MSFYERVVELADRKSLTVFELSEKVGLSRNAVYAWQKSSPKSDTLGKLADYLDVSTDYLLGRTDNPAIIKTAEEDFADFPAAVKEVELRKALENVMSFDGQPITENDKDAILAFMLGRVGK